MSCRDRSAQAALSMKKTSSRSTHSSSHREVSAYPHLQPHALHGCLRGAGGSHSTHPHTVCLALDSSTYATFLFNAFDTDHDGSVSFEVSRDQGGGQAKGEGSRVGRTHPFGCHGLG